MNYLKILFSPALKAVPALVNNDSFLKRRKKVAFDPRISPGGFNFGGRL
jgi:hypothetical protein